MSGKKILFFELNEVPFRVLDDYCGKHPDSFLAKTLARCRQFEARSEDRVLSPWVTWPTVHRGVGDDKHSIHYFGQHLERPDRDYPPIWKILSERGIRTGVFGSLHTSPLPADAARYAFFVPDTFAPGSECFPSELSVFQNLNLSMARQSARNVSTSIPWKEALRFMARMPALGLTPRTLASTARQLAEERVDGMKRIRRRTYQVILAFDIFMKQVRRTQPQFATFYTNHVASSMHRYWAAAFPGDYENHGYDAAWISRFSGEIDYAMSWFDAFFERMCAFVDAHPDYEVWVATSMGQAATEAVTMETQLYLTDLSKFMAFLGFPAGHWERRPAMEPQVSVQVLPEDAAAFIDALKSIRIDDAPLEFEEKEGGFACISLGQSNLPGRIETADVRGRSVRFEDLGMENVAIEDHTNSNAYHVPGGILLQYGNGHQRAVSGAGSKRPVISNLEIAPALLKNFGIEIPAYMSPGTLAS